jgi:hypothetical protein
LAFNNPLTAFSGKASVTTEATLRYPTSFLKADPANIRGFDPEKSGRREWPYCSVSTKRRKIARAKLTGFKPFSKVSLTNMLEYDEQNVPVNMSGSVDVSVKPYEIYYRYGYNINNASSLFKKKETIIT